MIDLSLLMPEFTERLKEFVLEAQYQGHDVDVQSALRSMNDQNKLYALGRTIKNPDGLNALKPMGNIVTNAQAGHSWHNWGVAADVVYRKDGKFTWNVPDSAYLALNNIASKYRLIWGGSWSADKTKALGDLDHWELTGGMPIQMAINLGNTKKVWDEIRKRI
jgi:hypothetical protein